VQMDAAAAASQVLGKIGGGHCSAFIVHADACRRQETTHGLCGSLSAVFVRYIICQQQATHALRAFSRHNNYQWLCKRPVRISLVCGDPVVTGKRIYRCRPGGLLCGAYTYQFDSH
jgi:hypothetical protein